MKELLEASKEIQHEYCCTVVRIGELNPIEGSDFLATTLVNRVQIVVRKDEVKPGDIMIYAMNETRLNPGFLSANNLFEFSERKLNVNYQEVQELVDKGLEDEAKRKVGFFGKHGRVRCIRLRKQPSFGFLFSPESLYIWKPEIAGKIDFESWIDKDFDTIGGELFVKVYIPNIPEKKVKKPKVIERGLKKVDHIVDGQFFKHYDTTQLTRAIDMINPDDVVDISVKIHGTSIVLANIICKVPKFINTKWKWFNNIVNYIMVSLPERFQKLDEKYDLIYSSRNQIRNGYINVSRKKGIIESDTSIYEEYGKLLKPYIKEGMTVYGEVFGYYSDSTKLIGYDYNCGVGKNKIMPYRITTQNGKGEKRYEWNISEVYEWTIETMKIMPPEIRDRIHPIDILYHGTLSELYPNIMVDRDWHTNVLEALKVEERFGMEKLEPMCNQKVPREGIVLRIQDDPLREAFKLKTVAYFEDERKRIDSGSIDAEMFETYYSNQDNV